MHTVKDSHENTYSHVGIFFNVVTAVTMKNAVISQKTAFFIHGVIQRFLKYINKTITFYLDLILHHHLQSSPLGSAHSDPSVSATFEMHPGSVSLLGCLVPSVLLLDFLSCIKSSPLQLDFHLGEEKEVGWIQ
jgi:hypothetical protein